MDRKNEDKRILLLTDNRGIYIPQDWYKECYLYKRWKPWLRTGWIAVPKWTRQVMETGPEHESYWDAWDAIENSAKYIDADGIHYWTLCQDGDLWIYRNDFNFDLEEEY